MGTPNREPQEYSRNIIGLLQSFYASTIFLGYRVVDFSLYSYNFLAFAVRGSHQSSFKNWWTAHYASLLVCTRISTRRCGRLRHEPPVATVEQEAGKPICGFSNIRGTLLGVPRVRIVVFWVPLFWETIM